MTNQHSVYNLHIKFTKCAPNSVYNKYHLKLIQKCGLNYLIFYFNLFVLLQNSGTNILQCTVCGKRQHSVCYGFLNSHEVESEFYCTQCISDAPYKMSQDVIYTNESDEQKVNILNTYFFFQNIHISNIDIIAQILPVFFDFHSTRREDIRKQLSKNIC